MRHMRFTKMHGQGNDYVYVSLFDEVVADAPALARRVSDRHTGVGSDGLILICPSDVADVRMEMYNADGLRGRMCGNGIRCVAKYAHDHGLIRPAPAESGRERSDRCDESMQRLHRYIVASGGTMAGSATMTIETDAGVLSAAVLLQGLRAGEVCVDMGCPSLAPDSIPTTLPGEQIVEHPVEAGPWRFEVTCVSTGSPHAVIFVEDLDGVDLRAAGPLLEKHPVFPDRINVHFVRVATRKVLDVRHWERGSGITQACGTGASAACVAGALTGRTDRDIEVRMPGGSLRTASASLVGDQGACILDRYHVQKGFFGAGGFTLEEGLTDTNQYEVELKQRMVERSKEVIAVVDSSKWGQVTFAALATVDQLHCVIADDGAPPVMVATLRERGVEVALV